MKPLELTTPTPISMRIVRTFDAPLALVRRAHTEPELVKRWATGAADHSLVACEIDFRVGGNARYVWKNPELEMEMRVEFLEIVAHERIVHTEDYEGWPEGRSTVTTTFVEANGRTTVTVDIQYRTREARDAALVSRKATRLPTSSSTRSWRSSASVTLPSNEEDEPERVGCRPDSDSRGETNVMTAPKFRSVLVLFVPALVLWAYESSALGAQDPPAPEARAPEKEKAMLLQYLEVVTADVDATCSALEKLHGVRFGEPEAVLGNARAAALKGGGRIGVRAPMRADEEPVVRPYVLVDDIEAAVEAAEAAGGELALRATEIPGHGKFAIYFQGGIQYGLWEL